MKNFSSSPSEKKNHREKIFLLETWNVIKYKRLPHAVHLNIDSVWIASLGSMEKLWNRKLRSSRINIITG